MEYLNGSAKRIAVCDKSRLTVGVLKSILSFCGRGSYRVAPADEPLEQNVQQVVLLLCDADVIPDAQHFSVCVADYEFAAQPDIAALCPLTYSVESDNADFTARNIRHTQDGFTAFEIVGVGVIGRVKLAAGGEPSVKTVLAAAAAAVSCGVPFAEVLEALNHIKM